ncbi:hypothetical protein [uncultured Gammaproteobacteria bacterium]|nr:hypothetical protein [uncultured Gammaproteobacteria bacterium]
MHAHFTSVDVVNSTLGFSSRYAWYSDGFCGKKMNIMVLKVACPHYS